MNKIKRTGMITRKYDRNNYFFLQKVKEIFCKKVKYEQFKNWDIFTRHMNLEIILYPEDLDDIVFCHLDEFKECSFFESDLLDEIRFQYNNGQMSRAAARENLEDYYNSSLDLDVVVMEMYANRKELYKILK